MSDLTISDKVNAYGLLTTLWEYMKSIRPSISRTTVYLALKEPTTPTRKIALAKAKELVVLYEQDMGIAPVQNNPATCEAGSLS